MRSTRASKKSRRTLPITNATDEADDSIKQDGFTSPPTSEPIRLCSNDAFWELQKSIKKQQRIPKELGVTPSDSLGTSTNAAMLRLLPRLRFAEIPLDITITIFRQVHVSVHCACLFRLMKHDNTVDAHDMALSEHFQTNRRNI